jgi:hypothetical protein
MMAAAKYITKELHTPDIPASLSNLNGYQISPHILAEKSKQMTAKVFSDDVLVVMVEPYTTTMA